MRATIETAAVAGLALLAAGEPQDSPARYVVDADSSLVWFDASATLGDFRGINRAVAGWATVPAGTGWAGVAGHITVAVDSFRTGMGMRDGHLRDEMETDRYPVIEFELVRVAPDTARADGRDTSPARAPAGGEPVILHGWLAIKATTRRVAIPATVLHAGDTLRLRGGMPARLTDFGVEPPSRFFGLAAMEDSLALGFDVRFVPAVDARQRRAASRGR